MQVVLNKDLKKLGYRGDVVNVKRGYFRNYLFPNGIADAATPERVKVNDSRKEKMVMKSEQLLENAKDVLTKLKGLSITFKEKVSDKGKLYGSITESDVVKAVEAETKLKLEKDFVKMDEHIKEVGEHQVVVHLGEGLEEKITVVVEEAS